MAGDIESLRDEVTRIRRQSNLLESFLSLAQVPDIEEQDLITETLSIVSEMLGSRLAYFFPLDRDQRTLGPPLFSAELDGERKTVVVGDAREWAAKALEGQEAVTVEGPLRDAASRGLEPIGPIARLLVTPVHGPGYIAGVGAVVDKSTPYDEDDRQLFPTIMASLWQVVTHLRTSKLLEGLVVTDPVTGLADRDRFLQLLHLEMRRVDRSGIPLAVVLADLDGFAQLNATQGRAAGDRILRRVGEALSSAFQRVGDLVARYENDTFALMLPNTDKAHLAIVAERTRWAIGEMSEKAADGSALKLTASVGCSLYRAKGPQASDLMNEALAGLESAKDQGGNHVGLPG